MINYANIPAELKILRQWVVFKITPDPMKPGKFKKMPIIAQIGFPEAASSTNPATWRDYDAALEICNSNSTTFYMGFALSENDPYCVIDLDQPATQEVANNQTDTLRYFEDSYQERSVSGNGFHIVCKAPTQPGIKCEAESCEIYTQERMIVFTGNTYNHRPIEDFTEAVGKLSEYLKSKMTQSVAVSFEQQASTMTPKEMLELTCKNHDFKSRTVRLIAGQFTAEDFEEGFSETTGSLMMAIACETETRDINALKQAFFLTGWFVSPIYQQHYSEVNKHKINPLHEHWNREANSAIGKAIAMISSKRNAALVAANLMKMQTAQTEEALSKPQEQATQEPEERFSGFPVIETKPDAWQHPPGVLLQEMIQFYMDASIRPNRAICLAAAITTMSGWAGRQFQTQKNAGLTFFGIMFGRSGIGKNDADRGYYTLSRALQNTQNKSLMEAFLDAHTGPGKITHEAAFRRNMATVYEANNESVSRVHFFKEIGATLGGESEGKGAVGLREFLLEAFGALGMYERLAKKEYAMVENNVSEMVAANIAFLGEGTKESIFDSLTAKDVDGGLLPRFCFVDCGNTKPEENENQIGYREAPHSLLTNCINLITKIKKMESEDTFQKIPQTQEATDWIKNLTRSIDKYTDPMEQYDPIRAMLGRYALIVIRLACIAAISKDINNPIVDMECVTWAQAFQFNSYQIAMACIEEEMSPLHEQRYATLAKELLKYFDLTTIGKRKGELRSTILVSKGFIQWSVLTNNLRKLKGFKEEAAIRFKTPQQLLKETLSHMIDDGIILASDVTEVRTVVPAAHTGSYYRITPDGLKMLQQFVKKSVL